MIAHFLSCILLGTAITFLVVVTISLIARLPQRTLEDVIVAIRPVQLDRLAILLDPANEWRLKTELAKKEFRLRQRRRIHQTLEIVSRMSHNAFALAEWSNKGAAGDEHATLRQELHERAVEVRAFSFVAVLILWTWIILRAEAWPFFFIPRLPSLRKMGGIDPVDSYERLKDAARQLRPDAQTIDGDDLLSNL